jgi:HK97 family phage prohead protease
MTIEKRSIATELRASEQKDCYELRGVAAAYNSLSKNLGGFCERIAPGAFTRSLNSGKDLKCLYNHETGVVLGSRRAGTLTVEDTKRGLEFRCQLNPASQQHRDIYESVKRGDVADMSFGFNVDPNGDEFDQAKDEKGQRFLRRTLKSVDLHEISVVTFPAYNSTAVSARSIDYRFVPEVNPEDLELLARVGNVGKLVAADEAAVLEDAQNILRAARLGNELRNDDFRQKLAKVRAELGI